MNTANQFNRIKEMLRAATGFEDDDQLYIDDARDAIQKLIETMTEQPAQQEPVAWMYDWICDGQKIEGWIAHKESEIPRLLAANIRPLYTSPPAQRTWVNATTWWGLTDEQIKSIYTQETGSLISDSPWALIDFARAIEAKLKDKNT